MVDLIERTHCDVLYGLRSLCNAKKAETGECLCERDVGVNSEAKGRGGAYAGCEKNDTYQEG